MFKYLVILAFAVLAIGADDSCASKSSLKDKTRDGLGLIVIERGNGNSDVEVYVITLEGKKFAVAVYQGNGVGITQIMEK
jgi:hypothetical protein